LRVIVNPSDNVSLLRIINQPKRSIGDSTINELLSYSTEKDIPLFSSVQEIPPALSARPRKCVGEFSRLLNELIALKEDLSIADFVEAVIDKTGLKAQYQKDLSEEGIARLENMDEFLGAVKEFENSMETPTLESFLENVALVTELDQAKDSQQHVTLMTLHSAKGLEFPVVFMCGMEDGLFPSLRSMNEENRLEEERRLCYVGITRAMERLYLSYADQRMLYNQLHHNAPSRFIDEIPDRLLDKEWISKMERSFGDQSPLANRPKRNNRVIKGPTDSFGVPQVIIPPTLPANNPLGIPGVQKGFTPSNARPLAATALQNLFAPGDRVMHKKFGEGNVIQIEGTGKEARIVIEFAAYGEKEFALHIAPIVKVGQ
ncbi:MAG: ATP-binding domain-containing protein, partial [Clostridiales bacterium]|nr:ATP-binding domain-containing protein [Clostridiales bacterium]